MSIILKMLKDASWMIKGRIVSFHNDKEYTEEQIGDDKIVKDMLRCGYAIKVEAEKLVENVVEAIEKVEQKVIETYENKMIMPEENKAPKKRAKKE